MIIYICPNCGEDLKEVVLASYPPQYKVYCPKCNWENIEKPDEIVRVPYLQISKISNLTIGTDSNVPLACKGCSNHPSNGGSGICHCILGLTPITW